MKADSRVKIVEDGNKYKLDITEVKLGDEGEYKVIIKNKLGEKAQQAILSVSRKHKHSSSYRSDACYDKIVFLFGVKQL